MGYELVEFEAALAVDPVTLFPNRESLIKDVGDVLATDCLHVLGVFTLLGSDDYRRGYGVLASNNVIAELAQALATTVGDRGRCYRSRADEFWVLIAGPLDEARQLLDAGSATLREAGSSARIVPALGMAFLPSEANTPTEALMVADQELGHARRARERRTPPRARS
jgi:GGDEF domain-containing protein